MKSEIRKDYIQDKYVIIAPRRGKRPHTPERPELVKKITGKCFFCPKQLNQERFLDKVGTKQDWQVAVVANKFPAVSTNNPKAYGHQEVVVETPDHKKDIEDLSISHIESIFEIYARRTEQIQKDKQIEYVLIFKNSGGKAGASIQHAHSQIFATKFLPPNLKDKADKIKEYRTKHGTCVYCDVINQERKSARLVYEDDQVICFTPYASIHNYEVWILPKRHLDNVTMLTAEERRAWAKVLKKVLKRIGKLNLPYNYYFHQVVSDENQHLYMKITPRGSVWAGVEIGSGLMINPIAPEEAAKYYREVFKK